MARAAWPATGTCRAHVCWLVLDARIPAAVGSERQTGRSLEGPPSMHKSVNADEDFYLKEFHHIRAQLELEGKQSMGIAAIFKDRRL
jgi:hypothetical protein